jgi:hypothetical protein
MGLTRPKIWDIDTNVTLFTDAITVLNQGATQANVDIGFLINRANGLLPNAAIYWSESLQSFTLAFTTDTGSTTPIPATTYANLTVEAITSNVVYTDGLFWSSNGAPINTGSGSGGSSTFDLANALPVFSGNINANNINTINTISANVVNTGIVYTDGLFWSNGFSISTGSGTGSTSNLAISTFLTNYASTTPINSAAISSVGDISSSGNVIAANVIAYNVETTNLVFPNGQPYSSTLGTLNYGFNPTVSQTTAQVTNITAFPTTIDTFNSLLYRGAKYLITVADNTSTQYQISEILLVQDGANVYITNYGIIHTGANIIATYSAQINSGTVTLYATGVSMSNSVKISRTLISI